MRTLIHISDLHFGKFENSSMKPILDAFEKIDPDTVIISGDFTMRARIKEFIEAKEFLKKLKAKGYKVFMVPGNHDIEPHYKPLSRAIHPYLKYQTYISTTLEPRYIDDDIALIGLNTVVGHTLKNGRFRSAQLKKAEKWLSTIPETAVKILVTHHPIDLPAIKAKNKLAKKADKAFTFFSNYSVDVYLSGHYHSSSSINTESRYKVKDYSAIAIQAGTLSKRQRGELPSFNVLKIEPKKIKVTTFVWDEKLKDFKIFKWLTFHKQMRKWIVPGN